MKAHIVILAAVLLVWGIAFAGEKKCGANDKSVLVTELKGKAFVSDDKTTWKELAKGNRVDEKKFVKTEKATTMTLQFPDTSTLKVGEASLLSMSEIVSNENCDREEYGVTLMLGKLWSQVKKTVTGKSGKYEIRTTTAVAGVRGTSFGFIVNPDESGAVMVLAGAVEVSPEKDEQAEEKPLNIEEWKKNRSKKEIAGPAEISKEEWESVVIKSMQMVKFDAKGKLSKPIPIGAHNAGEWFKQNSK